MKILRFTSLRVWASRLALSLVGFFFAVSSVRGADGYNAEFPPDSLPYETYYGIHVLITGAYDTVWIIDDSATFFQLAGDVTNSLISVASLLSSCQSDLLWMWHELLAYIQNNPDSSQDLGFLAGLPLWIPLLGGAYDDVTNGVDYIDTMARSVSETEIFTKAVYTADGDLTAFDGSVGGCDCVVWLEDILDECQLVNTRLSSWLQNIYYRLRQFTLGAYTVLGVSGDDYAFTLGRFVGTNLLFSSSFSSRLDSWLSSPVYNRFMVSSAQYFGDSSADSVAQVLTGFEQLFMVDDAPSGYSYGPYVDGMRDFATTGNVHPTNTSDNPLWVRFTNSVTLSQSSLDSFSFAITGRSLRVSVSAPVVVTNFNDLVSLLESANLYVSVTNTVTVQVDNSHEKQDLNTELETISDPSDDSTSAPTTDFSQLSTVGSTLSSVFSAYEDMFDAIPSEMPSRIFIHEGWTIGSITIPSIHWYIDDGSRSGFLSNGLSLIRGVFSAVWIVSYVILVCFFAAVDIFVAGVCVYMCYGLLAGDSKTALHGTRKMFNLLCMFLGFKAPFSESL